MTIYFFHIIQSNLKTDLNYLNKIFSSKAKQFLFNKCQENMKYFESFVFLCVRINKEIALKNFVKLQIRETVQNFI